MTRPVDRKITTMTNNDSRNAGNGSIMIARSNERLNALVDLYEELSEPGSRVDFMTRERGAEVGIALILGDILQDFNLDTIRKELRIEVNRINKSLRHQDDHLAFAKEFLDESVKLSLAGESLMSPQEAYETNFQGYPHRDESRTDSIPDSESNDHD